MKISKIIIRPAKQKDKTQIIDILKETDEFYKAIKISNFWVAINKGGIIATAQLKKYYNKFFFLSSIAVPHKYQGKGFASILLNNLLENINKDVYLYTIKPSFFKKFNFKLTKPIKLLPSKNKLECDDCQPEKCVCMVKSVK